MEGYYNEYKREPKERRSFVLLLADMILGLLTLIVAGVLVLTLIAPWVNPGRIWFFSILGLAAPAVYVATFLLMLYWIVRWRWGYAGLTLVLVAVGLFSVSLFYKPAFKRSYGEPSYDRNVFKFVTYNVRNFYGDNGGNSAAGVLQYVEETNPDIICFEEFNRFLIEQREEFSNLTDNYSVAAGDGAIGWEKVYDSPLLILSKYKILRSGTVLPYTSIWADLLLGEDTVRVFCNHLRSTAITSSDDAFITKHEYLTDSTRNDKIRSIVRRFRDNSILRAEQVDTIAQVIAATPGRKIVCGDFNDTPMSYVYRTMADGLNDAFREVGAGFSHTFRGFFNTLRIDFVLSSEGLEVCSYAVSDVNYSDHHPVEVRFKKSNY